MEQEPIGTQDITGHKKHSDGGSNLIGGAVLIVLGLLFLANNLIPEFHFGDYWPLILVVIGVGILWKNRRGN